MSKGRYTAEQVFNCCNCYSAPPCGLAIANNMYNVKEKETGKPVGIMAEDSSCCCRCLCPASARTSNGVISLNSSSQQYNAIKEFRCAYCFPMLPCCRPDVIIHKGGQIIGSVEMPCCPGLLCKYEVRCYRNDGRSDDNLLWTINKCVCNCHTICGKNCGCCMDACKYMDFSITPGKAGFQSISGSLQKEHFGCYNECFTMADKYNFDLPSQNDDENAIFLAAIQFIDMLWFENNHSGMGGI